MGVVPVRLLKEVQDVFCAVCRPHRQKPVVAVAGRPATADGHQPPVTNSGKNHGSTLRTAIELSVARGEAVRPKAMSAVGTGPWDWIMFSKRLTMEAAREEIVAAIVEVRSMARSEHDEQRITTVLSLTDG